MSLSKVRGTSERGTARSVTALSVCLPRCPLLSLSQSIALDSSLSRQVSDRPMDPPTCTQHRHTSCVCSNGVKESERELDANRLGNPLVSTIGARHGSQHWRDAHSTSDPPAPCAGEGMSSTLVASHSLEVSNNSGKLNCHYNKEEMT